MRQNERYINQNNQRGLLTREPAQSSHGRGHRAPGWFTQSKSKTNTIIFQDNIIRHLSSPYNQISTKIYISRLFLVPSNPYEYTLFTSAMIMNPRKGAPSFVVLRKTGKLKNFHFCIFSTYHFQLLIFFHFLKNHS